MTKAEGNGNDAVTLENVWQRDMPELRGTVPSAGEHAGGSDRPKQRPEQFVFAVRNKSGDVVGASTVRKTYVKRLRNHFLVCRMMIHPEYRIPGLTTELLVSTRDFLEKIHKQEEWDIPIGLLTVVEDERIRKFHSEAVWPQSKMVYIGNTSAGHHIRVYYFAGARIS